MKLSLLLFSCFILTAECFAQTHANQPAPVGFRSKDISAVDSIVNTFMRKYDVPGLSLVIAQRDTIKLVRTYGFADSAKKQPVDPDSRFRIASVSKPFTAAAIMQLIERGKLKLTDHIFGKGALLGTTYGSKPYTERVKAITVEHLLEHLGGGWGNSSEDPMFMHPEMNQAQLISWTLDNQPLGHEPGTNFEYSNFGYCLLGRVIEKVSGIKYADYVRKNILQPCGITTMEIGGNTLAERKPKEVLYYDKAENPYTMDQRRMDSHGGWIATPTDLVNFLTRVDKFPQQPDILKMETLTTMFTAPAVSPHYAKGWAVNSSNNYWHNGSLPGEQALAARINQNYCWAVMVNTRKEGDFARDLDELMWKVKGAIKQWP
ncbi:class A beta-lactamase-related serine hydrolase [Mucilaginibacter terrenus]|uniref:Class A beta-lactamase-related serine hydrolase n=1 Tax=Mucilaginibacter terrenus TaxID=2482727 RepID=A0A3E2NWV9_9SPHI|nr:serine hydrolase domain-containing protein [Mucilaginibacter terrenus]RFZ85340.1 class A beta-lactamase-related serine hydrolase [Mucilaginibacter terrenus]